MSALGPKADMCSAKRHVRFTPKADMCRALVHLRFVPIADIRLSVHSPDRGLFPISRIKSVDEPASLKFIDER